MNSQKKGYELGDPIPLPALARLLRNGTVEGGLKSVFERKLTPPSLARWLLCDQAQHQINYVQMGGLIINEHSLRCLDAARRFTAGLDRRQTLVATRRSQGVRGVNYAECKSKFAGKAPSTYDQIIGMGLYHRDIAFLAERACLVDAYEASLSIFYELRSVELDVGWLSERLAYLCDTWDAFGEETPLLLYQGSARIAPSEKAPL